MTTVICLDDYHSLDRKGRSAAGVTALDPKAQYFDLMHEQARWGGDRVCLCAVDGVCVCLCSCVACALT
jgi:hypothetical protein